MQANGAIKMTKENDNQPPKPEKPAKPAEVEAPPLVVATESYERPSKESTSLEKK